MALAGCGGNVVFVEDGDGGDGGDSNQGGNPSGAGASNQGGALSVGGSSADGCTDACGGAGATACEEANPAGFELISTLVYDRCGCREHSPCEFDCADDQVCITPGPHASTEACGTCVESNASTGQQCAVDAAFSNECQSDVSPGGCADYIDCVING